MSGPKRNEDKLNTIGIVVVGICSAVLVFVTIVTLQAFYMGDTSEIQTMADYGGQDTQAKNIKATQSENINKPSSPNGLPKPGTAEVQTYRIPIKYAMEKVVVEAKADAGNLIPALGRSECRTVLPVFGRPKADMSPPCAPAAAPAPAPTPTTPSPVPGTGSNPTALPDGAGSGSAAPAPGAGSAMAPTPTGGNGGGGGPAAGSGAPAQKPAEKKPAEKKGDGK